MPFRLLKAYHKIQQRLVRELEKKFSGRDVVIVANRRIMPPPRNGKQSARPRSRTLTAVSFTKLNAMVQLRRRADGFARQRMARARHARGDDDG